MVTLFFCLQRDPGGGEQRAEGGLASHSEYPCPSEAQRGVRHVDIPVVSWAPSSLGAPSSGALAVRNGSYRKGLWFVGEMLVAGAEGPSFGK